MEYASGDAVRRGASKQLLPSPATGDLVAETKRKPQSAPGTQPKRNKAKYSKETRPPRFKHGASEHPDKGPGGVPQVPADDVLEQPRHTPVHAPKRSYPKARPKPGAALAQAKRQSVAIVANSDASSKKIKFS